MFAPGSIGLSVEADELATSDLSATRGSLVALMRQLGPGVLRLGGNSLDYSWWTSTSEQPPSWATSVITPPDLASLRRLLIATGWRAILGVDLGHFDPARAANEATIAKHTLGSHLLGFEIGNEPNDYGDALIKLRPPTYTASDYLEELGAYSAAMHASAGAIRLYGPDVSSPSWLQVIASDKAVSLAAITQHYYPTSYSVSRGVCKATPVPTAVDLLSPEVRERESATVQGLVSIGSLAHRETRITETNTTSSCDTSGGPATSPVFASALWSLDWTLRSASAGVAGINFHGYFGRCVKDAYNPICAPNLAAEIRGEVIARPEYYGLFAAHQLQGGRFLPVDITGPNTSAAELTAYATVHPNRDITIAIDDLASHGTTRLSLRLPGYSDASEASLIAPSLDATDDVSFGHSSFHAGAAVRPILSHIVRRDGAFRITVRPASALILWLRH